MIIGLKIDVDTYRGTRDGVRPLCRLLGEHRIQGSFFFSVGPDNMGRHLWRLLKPAFLAKMLRSKAASLYGWDILLRGTFWPGPQIGRKLAPVIREVFQAGHEVGLHAWDHHAWQSHLESGGWPFIEKQLRLGGERLAEITGAWPSSSAAPGWKCNADTLLAKQAFPFRYNSDCRGSGIFRPRLETGLCSQPQVPTTLPTYDEVMGMGGIGVEHYNHHLVTQLKFQQLNVLTIHAEVEGIVHLPLFERFLDEVKSLGGSFVPLRTLVPQALETIPAGSISARTFPGREGWIAVQD